MDLKETEWEAMVRIRLAQDTFRYLAVVTSKFHEDLDESRNPLKKQAATTISVSSYLRQTLRVSPIL